MGFVLGVQVQIITGLDTDNLQFMLIIDTQVADVLYATTFAGGCFFWAATQMFHQLVNELF